MALGRARYEVFESITWSIFSMRLRKTSFSIGSDSILYVGIALTEHIQYSYRPYRNARQVVVSSIQSFLVIPLHCVVYLQLEIYSDSSNVITSFLPSPSRLQAQERPLLLL